MKKLKIFILLILMFSTLIDLNALSITPKERNKIKKCCCGVAALVAVTAIVKSYQSWDKIKKAFDDDNANPKETIKNFVENNKKLFKFLGIASISAFIASKLRPSPNEEE